MVEKMEKEWEENKVNMSEQLELLKKECAELQEQIKAKKEA